MSNVDRYFQIAAEYPRRVAATSIPEDASPKAPLLVPAPLLLESSMSAPWFKVREQSAARATVNVPALSCYMNVEEEVKPVQSNS